MEATQRHWRRPLQKIPRSPIVDLKLKAVKSEVSLTAVGTRRAARGRGCGGRGRPRIEWGEGDRGVRERMSTREKEWAMRAWRGAWSAVHEGVE